MLYFIFSKEEIEYEEENEDNKSLIEVKDYCCSIICCENFDDIVTILIFIKNKLKTIKKIKNLKKDLKKFTKNKKN